MLLLAVLALAAWLVAADVEIVRHNPVPRRRSERPLGHMTPTFQRAAHR